MNGVEKLQKGIEETKRLLRKRCQLTPFCAGVASSFLGIMNIDFYGESLYQAKLWVEIAFKKNPKLVVGYVMEQQYDSKLQFKLLRQLWYTHGRWSKHIPSECLSNTKKMKQKVMEKSWTNMEGYDWYG